MLIMDNLNNGKQNLTLCYVLVVFSNLKKKHYVTSINYCTCE